MKVVHLLVVICTISNQFIRANPNPTLGLDDDDDILKELEQILGGGGVSNPNSNSPSPSVDSTMGVPSTSHEVSGTGCVCKKYYECNVAGGGDGVVDNTGGNGKPNPFVPVDDGPDGQGMSSDDLPELDIRFGPTSECGHYTEICCDSVRDNATTSDLQNPPYKHGQCGKRNEKGVGFRAKGAVNQEAQFGEFPWMAAIVSIEPRGSGQTPINVFVCGGSLIAPSVLLTAGHCVYKKSPRELKVRLGEWDTQTSNEIYPHKDYSVANIIVHEGFYPGALYNDVALLLLDREVEFAPHIDTVCLPTENVFSFDGQRCFASGWGRDSFGKEGKYQVILKKLDLPIVPQRTCENALRRTRLGRYFKLHESFVCAGGEKGRDTCRGDGGSPLVCKVPGAEQYVQYGIVAWGVGCGDEGVPGVYVNVPMFVPWISKKMAEARLDTTYFKVGRSRKLKNYFI